MADVALGARELDEVAGAGMTAFIAVEDPHLELLFGVEVAHDFPFRQGDRGVVGLMCAATLAGWIVPPLPAFISTSSCNRGGGTVVLDVWTLPQSSATIVVMSTQSLRDVRDHLSEVIDRVEHHHERVVVTRNGKPAAVIMSPEDLEQLQETIDVLSDAGALADIREADAAYARGDVVRGINAVRQLRP